MKQIKLINGSKVGIAYVFKRLEITFENSSGKRETKVLEGKSGEMVIKGTTVRIAVIKKFYLFLPMVDIYENGVKRDESDTNKKNIYQDFKQVLACLVVGNLFYILYPFFFEIKNYYLLGFFKAFGIGFQSFQIESFTIGLILELIAFHLIRKKNVTGCLLVMLLIVFDTIVSVYFFNPFILSFAVILRGIFLPRIFYLGILLLRGKAT